MRLIQQVWSEKEHRYIDWGPEIFDHFNDSTIAAIVHGYGYFSRAEIPTEEEVKQMYFDLTKGEE